MLYKSLLRNGALIVMAGLLTFTSCRRNNKDTTPALTSTDDNGGYASDAVKLDQNSNDVISISDAAGSAGGTN